MREWIYSKKRFLELALEASETDKDKEYIHGVEEIYRWFEYVIDDYEKRPEGDEIQFIGRMIDHTSGRVCNLNLDLKYYTREEEKNTKAGTIAAYQEILGFCREMRRSFNEEMLNKYDREGNKWRPKNE